eukprot:Skav227158  [mRNA]  locus=scaffold502:95440:96366:- [translate_table: standard]
MAQLCLVALLGIASGQDCAEVEVPQFLQKSLQLQDGQDARSNIETDAVKVASRAAAKEEGRPDATNEAIGYNQRSGRSTAEGPWST